MLDLEVISVLRRMSRSETLPDRVELARRDYLALRVRLYSHRPLLDRVWELRHNLSAYDGAYAALAEALDAPLLTRDSALAGAPGHSAEIELYA